MMVNGLLISLFIFIEHTYGVERGSYIGCYKYKENLDVIVNVTNVQDCISTCEKKYMKFAVLGNSNTSCSCSEFLGEIGSSKASEKCIANSVYSSKSLVPDPPKNFHVTSITDEGVHITWEKPDNFKEITSYEITASVIHTFSQYPVQNNTVWIYSNNTFQTTLNLQSASKYNLTIRALSGEDIGKPASNVFETLLGVPDNIPYPPEILSRKGSKMTVKIHPVINNNGPISYYQLVVLDKIAIFQSEFLKDYKQALSDGLNFYITAELKPDDLKTDFIVGDGKFYGNYFNAPLLSSLEYNLIVGIVSSYKNQTKVAFSNSSLTNRAPLVQNYKGGSDTSTVTILLILGIIILSILLIGGVVVFFILRKRVIHRHGHNRLNEQELTVHGPMITIENSAYLPEEEQIPVNHYKNLKQKVRILNLKDDLSVDAHSIIGQGKFGVVCNAVLKEKDSSISLAAYTIQDKNLAPEQKKMMLKDLDMLIKCEKHENLIELVGTSESSHVLYVVLKIFSTNLKQFLISNRVLLPNRFCKVSEFQVLGIITQITHGLLELERNQIYHKQLCARNIMLTEDLVPKISGFGLADYMTDKELDYTRWTALEALKGQHFNSRSVIWSFGVLLWEICALGATPYSNISHKSDLVDKISRGTRLPQLKYFNDDLYQIMLNCWQVDMGERPNCESLCQAIESLEEDTIIPFINFNFYQIIPIRTVQI
ncbi:hypothetical protein WA026_012237 [Henosepilachna vigintioctopunctata]|uniref:Tyrosine-protein kinase Wsck n=1 Tax=Henosepilachna vigintioctopunctata TaxID=420089 RepID=A0AAW1VB78_9CUCU